MQEIQQHLIEHHGLTNSMVFTQRWCEDYHRRQHQDSTAECLGHYHDRNGNVEREPTIHEKAQHHLDALRDLLAKMTVQALGTEPYSLGAVFDLTLAMLSAQVEHHRIVVEHGHE